MDKYNPGDTWVFIDPENGNQGTVWLAEASVERAKGGRFNFDIWYWSCSYQDGSCDTRSFDWETTKPRAVKACATRLYGMGSRKTRFKFNPGYKFGEAITQSKEL